MLERRAERTLPRVPRWFGSGAVSIRLPAEKPMHSTSRDRRSHRPALRLRRSVGPRRQGDVPGSAACPSSSPGARRPPIWQPRRRHACEREQVCSFHAPSLSVARGHEPDQRNMARHASSRPRKRLAWRRRSNALRGMPSWFLRKPGGRVKERKSNRPSESMADAACSRQSPILGRHASPFAEEPFHIAPRALPDAGRAGNPRETGKPGNPAECHLPHPNLVALRQGERAAHPPTLL